MSVGEIRNDRIFGTFTAGTPAYTGKLNCKAVIWHDCPMYKRKQQDQQFIFAPETIEKASPEIKGRLSSVAGIDGIFPTPLYFYAHNFLASRKKRESNDENFKGESRLNEQIDKDKVAPLSDLQFISLYDETLVKDFLVKKKDEHGNDTNEIARPVTFQGANAAHHMWIDDGSLFVHETILQDDFDTPPSDVIDDFQRSFYPRWEYFLYNAPPGIVLVPQPTEGESQDKGFSNYKHLPYMLKTSPGDPVDFLQALKQKGTDIGKFILDDNKSYYRNVNPGIHWRVLKRTPVFQGEDFWVEFHRKSQQSDISITTKNAKFRTRAGLEYLDPYQSGVNGQSPNAGIVDRGPDNQQIENGLKRFDFSDQTYYIIEIGVGDPDDHYMIILAERDYPIFCHVGKFYAKQAETQNQSTGEVADTSSSLANTSGSGATDCNAGSSGGSTTQSDQSSGAGGSTTTPVITEVDSIRRLSRYSHVSSRLLLQREHLRVTVRQHLGKIIVTFSGYEDTPWIITRSDLTPVPHPDGSPDGSEDFTYETKPMIIARSKIALMGGNSKVAFSFGVLYYDRSVSFPLTQRLSIQGPVGMNDINLLLRDKGVTRHPQISSGPRSFEYTQEAEVYSEVVFGRPTSTKAMSVQAQYVLRYGKAPDMQAGTTKRRVPSLIAVSAKDCTRRIGSDVPYVKVVEVDLILQPGTYIFNPPEGDGGEPWQCIGCITPIFTGFRLYVPPDGEAFASPGIDVSYHIMKISDNWKETDLLRLQHDGRIQFLVNRGMHKRFSDGQPNHANYLRSLADKNFFIQISIWWDDFGAMPTPNFDRDRIIFTGICTDSAITEENGKHIMTCNLSDYTKVLQEQVFLNSPFFDKMRDFNAVSDIIQMAGFRDDDNLQPGSLIRRLAEGDDSGWFQLPHNGETIYNQEYALPGSYNILQEPMFKFKEGTYFADAIAKMGQIAGKVTYFDRLGVFHYEKLPYDQELFGGQQGSSPRLTIRDWERLAKIDFFASPKDVSLSEGKEVHRMVFDSYTVSRDMSSVVNEIRVISNTPGGELLLAGHTNFDSLFDIEKPGFVGYPKTLLQMDGIFGDEANVKYIVQHYTKLFEPPIKIKFKAIGHNLLKALDIVTFRGLGWRDKQVLIVESVSSEIDPETQTWWQDFECYWIYPSQNIEWGSATEINIGPDSTLNS